MLKKDVYNLTNSQKNIWDTEMFFNNSNLNNVGGYVFIEEKVNFKFLEKALNLYVQRNDRNEIEAIPVVNREDVEAVCRVESLKDCYVITAAVDGVIKNKVELKGEELK